MGSNVRPRVNRWESTAERDVLDAEHEGYARLTEPVIHRRVVTFEKRKGYWIIEDIFRGEGLHRFEFFFNFDAGIEVRLADRRGVAGDGRSKLAVIPISDRSLEEKIESRWVSLAYGTRISASGIMFRLNAVVPCKNVILLIPYRLGDEDKVDRCMIEAEFER